MTGSRRLRFLQGFGLGNVYPSGIFAVAGICLDAVQKPTAIDLAFVDLIRFCMSNRIPYHQDNGQADTGFQTIKSIHHFVLDMNTLERSGERVVV